MFRLCLLSALVAMSMTSMGAGAAVPDEALYPVPRPNGLDGNLTTVLPNETIDMAPHDALNQRFWWFFTPGNVMPANWSLEAGRSAAAYLRFADLDGVVPASDPYWDADARGRLKVTVELFLESARNNTAANAFLDPDEPPIGSGVTYLDPVALGGASTQGAEVEVAVDRSLSVGHRVSFFIRVSLTGISMAEERPVLALGDPSEPSWFQVQGFPYAAYAAQVEREQERLACGDLLLSGETCPEENETAPPQEHDDDGETRPAPGPDLLVLLAAAAFVLFAARRRPRRRGGPMLVALVVLLALAPAGAAAEAPPDDALYLKDDEEDGRGVTPHAPNGTGAALPGTQVVGRFYWWFQLQPFDFHDENGTGWTTQAGERMNLSIVFANLDMIAPASDPTREPEAAGTVTVRAELRLEDGNSFPGIAPDVERDPEATGQATLTPTALGGAETQRANLTIELERDLTIDSGQSLHLRLIMNGASTLEEAPQIIVLDAARPSWIQIPHYPIEEFRLRLAEEAEEERCRQLVLQQRPCVTPTPDSNATAHSPGPSPVLLVGVGALLVSFVAARPRRPVSR